MEVPQVIFNLNNCDFYLSNDIASFINLSNISDRFLKTHLPEENKIIYENLNEEIKSKIGKFRKNATFYSFKAFNKFWVGRESDLDEEVNKKCEELFDGKTFRHISFETATISRLKQAFPQLIFNDQYRVEYDGKYYRIDTYIKEYKIAIEVDELHHKQQVEEDIKRQEKIEEKLGCEFIRIKKDTDIIDAIAKINNIIFENNRKLQEENTLLRSEKIKLKNKIKYLKDLIKNMTNKI